MIPITIGIVLRPYSYRDKFSAGRQFSASIPITIKTPTSCSHQNVSPIAIGLWFNPILDLISLFFRFWNQKLAIVQKTLKNHVLKYVYQNKVQAIIDLTNKYPKLISWNCFLFSPWIKSISFFFDNLAKKPKTITLNLSNYINNQLIKTRSFFSVR